VGGGSGRKKEKGVRRVTRQVRAATEKWTVVVKAAQMTLFRFVKWIFVGIIVFVFSGSLLGTIDVVKALLTFGAKGNGKRVAR